MCVEKCNVEYQPTLILPTSNCPVLRPAFTIIADLEKKKREKYSLYSKC